MTKLFRIKLLIAAALFAIALAVSYLATPGRPSRSSAENKPTAPSQLPLAGREGAFKTVTTPPKTFAGRFSPDAASMEEFSSNPKRDASEQVVIDIVAQRAVPKPAKVKRLLELISSLPPDAQTLAMEHATALIPDGDYLTYRHQLFGLATTAQMREAVIDDSLTRGEDLRLPNLLELMRSSQSEAEKKEIRGILEAYLDKDYGPHPVEWEAPLRKWVAENSTR